MEFGLSSAGASLLLAAAELLPLGLYSARDSSLVSRALNLAFTLLELLSFVAGGFVSFSLSSCCGSFNVSYASNPGSSDYTSFKVFGTLPFHLPVT
jgi:hypothetical protein